MPKKFSMMACVLVAASVGAQSPGTPSPALLHEIFQDHAVLQRGLPIPVWGSANAGDRISVRIDGNAAEARADASGHWRTALPAMRAGGPYSLTARTRSGASQMLTDVLVGDVYLCSGQSNMELPVANSLNAGREIAGSADDAIRLLSVAHAASPTPSDHFQEPVSWAAAGPATVRDFSAACYYFARELRKTLSVPLGLIQSSWSGSRIEPWMSESALGAVGGFEQRLALLHAYAVDAQVGNRLMGESWEDWWRTHAPKNPMPWHAAGGLDWQEVPLPMRDWKTWGVPELANHDGMVWFRRSVTLTASQAASAASLSLGAIDEVDETWVNERPIGNSFGYGTERTYRLPKDALHAGENSIVVNVLSTWDAGGMYGPPDHMALRFAGADSVSLAGGWRYQGVPDSMGLPPRAPWESVAGLTGVYNAMIAPLEPYGLRGVLWYQGESNAGEADRYQALLSGLMSDWRRKFHNELPFLIVELPNFGAPHAAPAPSAWASLREAQRRAVADDSRAALAVTIDLGEAQELHPPNKQGVGSRLARAARHLIYGESIPPSGPIARGARRDNDRVIVDFDDVEGMLTAYSALRPTGFELCGIEQESCRFVDASLRSNSVVLDNPGPVATRVRFCWGDAPVCNLYDKSGLPAGPFEIPIR